MNVVSLHVYPLKSGAVVDCSSREVGALGLSGDRLIMVVDRFGKFVTQRSYPRLALVRVIVDGNVARFSAPGREDFVVRCDGSRDERGREITSVEIWGDWVDAVVLDSLLDVWMSEYLGDDVRVVRFAEGAERIADQTYAAPGDRVGFADGFAVLVTGTASLAALNARLAEPVPMSRFRPNIVVETSEPWAEDRWRRIRVGEVELAVVKTCGRCVIINVDQDRGVSEREPLRTLTSFRQQGKRVLFGQNATPRGVPVGFGSAASFGTVRVGDPVEVVESE